MSFGTLQRAIVGLLESGKMPGGHVPQQWSGMDSANLEFCFIKMYDLLEANRKRLGSSAVWP